MKKVSVLFTVLLAMLAFTSCECNHNETPTNKQKTITLDLHVNSADWQWSKSKDGGYYFYTFSVPELTKTIYDYGIVVVYREYNKGTSNAYQISLPRIFPMTDAGSGEVYSQIVDFSYLPQQVEIAVTNSDFMYDLNTNPEDMDFRLVMQWIEK